MAKRLLTFEKVRGLKKILLPTTGWSYREFMIGPCRISENKLKNV